MFRLISKFCLWVIGWSAEGEFPYHLKKCIVIVGPHTSNWDFVVGVLFRSALRMHGVRYLGKKELFDSAFGFFFRWLGGYPVDRSTNNNVVDEVTAAFNTNEKFAIALSPEGTRRKVDRLKTGFYNIARLAQVPIVMAGLDYRRRRAVFADPFLPSGDQEEDFRKIVSFFASVTGKNPENGMSHLLDKA